MFGYRLIKFEGLTYKLAEPEKLILDYLYLNPSLTSAEDLNGLRLNMNELNTLIDIKKMKLYLAVFNNRQLEKRMRVFLKHFLDHA
jgi:hypothetical protein